MSLLTVTQDTGSKCVPLDSAIVSVSRILTPELGNSEVEVLCVKVLQGVKYDLSYACWWSSYRRPLFKSGPSASRQKVACYVPSDLIVSYTLLERFTLLKNNNFLFVQIIDCYQGLQRLINMNYSKLKSLLQEGKSMRECCSSTEFQSVQQAMDELNTRWQQVTNLSIQQMIQFITFK